MVNGWEEVIIIMLFQRSLRLETRGDFIGDFCARLSYQNRAEAIKVFFPWTLWNR